MIKYFKKKLKMLDNGNIVYYISINGHGIGHGNGNVFVWYFPQNIPAYGFDYSLWITF